MQNLPKKLAKDTGDEAERETAAFFKQNCMPANVRLGLSPNGALAYDLVIYPPELARSEVGESKQKLHANVVVRMSDYLLTRQKSRYGVKYYLTNSTGDDPLDFASLGCCNVGTVAYLSKRAGGSIKDQDGRKLYRASNAAFRFKALRSTNYVELTSETCARIRERIEYANTVATFDVKAGKTTQLGGTSLTAHANGYFEYSRSKNDGCEAEMVRLLTSACTDIARYLSNVVQPSTSFKVLIDVDHCALKSITGVPESIYNAAKFNIKLTGDPEDSNLVYQSICRTQVHANTFFERVI